MSNATSGNLHRQQRRGWWLRAALLAASATASLGLAELVVRWRIPQLPCSPASETAIVLYYDQPNDQMRLTPNWQGYLGGVWAQVNRNGYRDRLYAPYAPLGTIRVAVIGDSYTMGDGVALEKAYPKQLEAMLSSDFEIEVLNCGISATNSIQQLATLGDVLETYHPHLVVLGYNVNDFSYYTQTRFERSAEAGWIHNVQPDGRVTIRKPPLTPFQKVKMAIRCKSDLYRLLVSVRDWLVSDRTDSLSALRSIIDAGEHLRSFEAVEKMKRLCDTQDVTFRVVVLPGLINIPPWVNDMADYPLTAEHKMICDQLAVRDVTCTDISDVFAGHRLIDLVVHRLNRHYNDQGNALIAAGLRQLLASDLVQIQARLPKRASGIDPHLAPATE